MHKVNQWMEVYILKENIREASVVMAKCRASHRTYGIRIERKRDNVWHCTWAFQLTEKAGVENRPCFFMFDYAMTITETPSGMAVTVASRLPRISSAIAIAASRLRQTSTR